MTFLQSTIGQLVVVTFLAISLTMMAVGAGVTWWYMHSNYSERLRRETSILWGMVFLLFACAVYIPIFSMILARGHL